MTVDAPFDAGLSGGPVVDDRGAVVALAIGVERLSGVGIALPVDAISSLVDGFGAPAPTVCESTR
jgi:S1-C subfamily serine protease